MSQPQWSYIDNLGDVNFLDYGGALLYEDKTGVYSPEIEIIQEPYEGERKLTVYRFSADKCKLVEDVESQVSYLVPDSYDATWPHPLHRYDEWFHKHLQGVASCCGADFQELRSMFCSEDVRTRAQGYIMLGQCEGYENLDGYPLRLTLSEAKKRYRKELKRR